MCACMVVCLYIYIYMYLYKFVYVCMYLRMHVCLYGCIKRGTPEFAGNTFQDITRLRETGDITERYI